MYAVSPAWLAAHDAPGKQVTVLVELLALGRTLTNAATPAAPTAERLLLSVRAGSIGEVTNTLDPWTGLAQIAQVQVQVSNTTGFARTLGPTFRKSAVRLRLGIGALTTLADFLPVFTGHVEQVQATGPVCTLTLVPSAFSVHRDLSVPIQRRDFPNAPPESLSQAIPLLVGQNIDVEAIPLTAAVTGTLARPLGTGDTFCWLTEFAAPFPATGTIDLGAETGVFYGSRAVVVDQQVNYLVLSALVRPAPVAHDAGTPVTLSQAVWQYLLGTDCTVLQVKNNASVVDPASYTLVPFTTPLAGVLVEFATAQGLVTADLDGGNLDAFVTPLVNGDFETGDLTGWTLTQATGVVTTGSTPDGSLSKAEVTATTASPGTLTQTVTLPAGRSVTLQGWAQQRYDLAASLVTNGDFATGDLTGWTRTVLTETPDALTMTEQFGATGGFDTIPDSASQAALTFAGLDAEALLRYSQVVTVSAGVSYTVQWSGALGGASVAPDGTLQSSTTFAICYASLTLVNVATGVAIMGRSHTQIPGTFADTLVFTAPSTQVRLDLYHHVSARNLPPSFVSLRQISLVLTAAVSQALLTVQLGTASDPIAYAEQGVAAGLVNSWQPLVVPALVTTAEVLVTCSVQATNLLSPQAVWLDAIRFEDLGRHPVDVIRWVIETFVPGLAINAQSFHAAYLARGAWRCGGQWRDPGHSRALLTRLADQFELRYFENGAGEACLVPLDLHPAASVPAATLTAQTARAWSPSGEPPTQLATDLYVYYNPRRGQGGTDPAHYGGVVYATPEGTTGAGAWQVACYRVAQEHGIRQTLRYFAEAIQDQLTAHLKLQALVERYTTLGTLVTCTDLVLRDAPLEIGDVIAVQHPVLGDLPQVGEVLGVRVDLSTPALTVIARLTDVLGTEERYEVYAALLGQGTEEAYPDVVVTDDEGTEEGYNP